MTHKKTLADYGEQVRLGRTDGKRRVMELKNSQGQIWHIDIPDTVDDEHARLVVTEQFFGTEIPAIVDQNGGGWKVVKILPRFPHEEEPVMVGEQNEQ